MHQARQVTFCCGRVREPWSSVFSGVQRVYNEFHYNLSDTTSPFAPKTRHVRGTPIWVLDNLEAWTRNDSQSYGHTLISDYSTLDILMDFQSFECSDPRDRLYALSNLFSGARKFPADYSSPWRTVYTNFVQHCLESEAAETPYFQHLSEKSSKTLSVLLILAAQQASKRGESASSEEELPLWVPDWQQSFDKVEPVSIEPVEGAEIRERRLFTGLYQCGTFRNRGSDGQQTLDFVDMDGRSYDDAERYLPLRQPFSPDFQDGDLVCGPLCHHMTSFGSLFALVLRPTGRNLQVHRITGLYAISMSAFENEDVSKLSRVARHFEII